MTTVDGAPTTAQDVLDATRELAPTIAGRAAEIEAGRRVPRDLLDELIGAGCFRLLLPPQPRRPRRRPARRDAGVRGAGRRRRVGRLDGDDRLAAPGATSPGCPAPTFDALFAGGADVIVAGALQPDRLDRGRRTAATG